MTHTTANTSTSDPIVMGSANKKLPTNSFSSDDLSKHSSKLTDEKDVTKWSSGDVQHWIKQQCKKFELKKATAEKFELNGQALALLTKHDFLRRSPDGGEVLYYALQRLINPNKVNSARLDQRSLKHTTSGPHPRIVEVNGDEGSNGASDPSSSKPIIEEPDDPPAIRRTQSETNANDYYPQQRPSPFFFNAAHMQPPVFAMSAGSAAAYFNRPQGFPRAPMHHPHPHPHMHQQHFVHPQFIHQYHPMMSAQGILIEMMDDTDAYNHTPNGHMNGADDSLYMVTINGQRIIMTEEQVRLLLHEVHQRQTYQENLQQQQQFHQQQQQFQQQQQQQYFQQQAQHRQQRPFPEQQRF